MAKEYDIFTKEDFDKMVKSFENYFKERGAKGLPFQKIRIIAKRWRKPKSSAQHRKYWVLVTKLKDLFIQNGYDTNENEVHEFIKKKAGFTKEFNGLVITKSIADSSEDATSSDLNRLIECMVRFSAEEFSYNLDSDYLGSNL